MIQEPLISIIIPTFNRAHLIGETLDSILNQSYRNWECIVVDDGSTDNTDTLLKSYTELDPRFKYVKRPNSYLPGGNGARNFGFSMSKGEFINWFDSDDVMNEDLLKFQLSSIKKPEIDVSLCQAVAFKSELTKTKPLKQIAPDSKFTLHNYIINNVVWLTPAALWRRSFLVTMNTLFDEELKAAQEWEFHCRILNKQPNVAVLNIELIYVREHEGSITYDGSDVKRWHYFVARLKLYNNPKIRLDNPTKLYLKGYLLSAFKQFVIHRNFKWAFRAFFNYIMKDSLISVKSKLMAFLFMVSFLVFNKGYHLSKKIK
ncbi:Glycosyl transferase family 2 [Formosa sp. Hel1_31_208]|uniref:glycosyltransferase family 2 protein n=1 Tax=Formosa sp. Hel1_31_208 TaxID=1798225 RepID=UPI00087BDB39|nr:glycosyltransferase family 2 protein [Formosa sp. Hel1_31_208]SDS69108.1 Glycosyl transferase family 2 [Formosa sp. Hel1_31_208]